MKKYKKYAFRLDIDGLEIASFMTAGPLEGTIAVSEDKEGGDKVIRKELGRVNYSNVVLTRGVSDSTELWDWWKLARDTEDYEKDVTIHQLNRAGESVKSWDLDATKPIRFKAADFDGGSDDNNIEELELAIEGFDPS